MDEATENRLDQFFDSIIFQLSKGNTIEGIKRGRLFMEFEKVKEWKSRFGYQFHIYLNDHFISIKTFLLINLN